MEQQHKLYEGLCGDSFHQEKLFFLISFVNKIIKKYPGDSIYNCVDTKWFIKNSAGGKTLSQLHANEPVRMLSYKEHSGHILRTAEVFLFRSFRILVIVLVKHYWFCLGEGCGAHKLDATRLGGAV